MHARGPRTARGASVARAMWRPYIRCRHMRALCCHRSPADSPRVPSSPFRLLYAARSRWHFTDICTKNLSPSLSRGNRKGSAIRTDVDCSKGASQSDYQWSWSTSGSCVIALKPNPGKVRLFLHRLVEALRYGLAIKSASQWTQERHTHPRAAPRLEIPRDDSRCPAHSKGRSLFK